MSKAQGGQEQTLLARVVMWVVPSVTALMVIVGFVASTAHFALLGFDPGFIGTIEYAAVSGEFLRDLASVGFTVPNGLLTLILDWPRSVFLAACFRVWFELGKPKLSSMVFGTNGTRSKCPIVILAVVLALKFFLLDGPLTRIDNVIVAFNKPSQVAIIASDAGLSLENRLEAQKSENWVASYIPTRARIIWEDMKCSRVHSVKCVNSKADSASAVRAEFLAHLLACILVALIIARLLQKTRSACVMTWALIGALSCLSLPYAYGKLERSTHYLYGILTLKGSAEQDASATVGKKPVDKAARSPSKPGNGEVTGIVLLHDANFVSVLTRVDLGPCPPVGPGGSPGRMFQTKLWQLANDEVVSIKEIRRSDVIEWKALVEQSCPEAGKPKT